MKIEAGMNLSELATRIKYGGTEEKAKILRGLLVERYDGHDTDDIPEAIWQTLVSMAFRKDNPVYNDQAMAILKDAVAKLQAIGVHAMVAPCSLPTGMSVSIHTAMTADGMDGAYVNMGFGAEISHASPQLLHDGVQEWRKTLVEMESEQDENQ